MSDQATTPAPKAKQYKMSDALRARDRKGDGVQMGTGGMISPFWGEFLVTPSALEWSLNYCSHACVYCFANLNAPTRKGDASKALRQVAELGKRATLTDMLMRNGYPVVVANKSDPFSESNYRETVPVLNAMKEAGIPLQFQTKGGKGIDDVLDGLPPSVWYITICQTDDKIRKRIEPNAPTLDERHDLIDQLIEKGHHVVVGVNPSVPEWLDDPRALMKRLADQGVWGVWLEAIHLSHKQVMFMPEPVKRAIGGNVMKRVGSVKKEMPREDAFFLQECMDAAQEFELQAYCHGHPDPSYFFTPWRDVYKKTMPILQDFANTCHYLKFDESRLISFDDYIAALEGAGSPFMKGKHRIGDYMRVVSYRTIENISNWTDTLTYRQLLWFAWCNPGNKLCPTSHSNFAAAVQVDKDGDNGVLLTDDKGAPYYVFVPGGTDEQYYPWNGEPG